MSYFTHRQLFYINSRNRLSGTDSNFSFQLNIDPNHQFDKVAVIDCSVPKSYYIVRDGWNTFTLNEDGDLVVITVPPGNYNRTSLRLTLQSLLNSESPNTYSYTIANENINQTGDSGKYTFSVTGNGLVQPQLIFSDGMYEQMGFDKDSTNSFVADSLTSTNVVNLNPEGTLFLRSNICQQSSNDILQNIITVQDSTFSYITFNNNNIPEYSKDFSGTRSNNYTFRLTDEDGDEIDLNGLNIVITLMLYKTNKFESLATNYIKMKSLE